MATTPQLQLFKYGQSSLIVHSDDFEDGYANGLLDHLDHESSSLTATALAECIVKNALDSSASREWNAGYILGIALSLLLGTPDTAEPAAPQVLFGPVTLRLNNWRFREGFYVGQDDYQAGQSERGCSPLVTANDLLRSVAHYDTQRQRYFFDQSELDALEDMFGRFTGFLCAALFAPTKERVTEPLSQVVLHEAQKASAACCPPSP